MRRVTYNGEADLQRLQDFNAAAIAATDHCGYLHPGDIPHHLYNGNQKYDAAEIMTLWEDERGLAAWLLVGPGHRSFDAQVRPHLRGGAFERDLLAFAGRRTAELMRRHGIAGDHVYADVFRCDGARTRLLQALGWQIDGDVPYVLNRTAIEAIPTPSIPDGYSLQTATGGQDAAALAEVHNASFGSSWTAETYRRVMESPGYAPERELLIRAPDDSFAAFTVIWFDHRNRTGLFEPVGTHRDHRRRGLGRALLRWGMRRMAAAGMRYATVAHFGDNEAARGLYQGAGFRPWHIQDQYGKGIQPP
jgi:mycothiol synthase